MPRQARVIVPGFPHHIVQLLPDDESCSSGRSSKLQRDRNSSIDEASNWREQIR